MQFESDLFKQISTIIERDSKNTTYKFALLRGVIEIIQEYPHMRQETTSRVIFPLGLLIEKWLLYYYPIIASPIFIPQRKGETEKRESLGFRKGFNMIVNYYKDKGGFSTFYNDYKNGRLPDDIKPDFLKLVHSLRKTITQNPMRYLGISVLKKEYSIFSWVASSSQNLSVDDHVDPEYLIQRCGTFEFSKELFVVFQYVGNFIAGMDSLLLKWAEFTVNADKTGRLTIETVLNEILKYPQTERDVYDIRKFYETFLMNSGELECVWSGKPIKSNRVLQVDHVIPFSIWKNNDLWNLLPTHHQINRKKLDKIPSERLLERRKIAIFKMWDILNTTYEVRFFKEIKISLMGNLSDLSGQNINWQRMSFEQLKKKCQYLTEIRGLEAWEYI